MIYLTDMLNLSFFPSSSWCDISGNSGSYSLLKKTPTVARPFMLNSLAWEKWKWFYKRSLFMTWHLDHCPWNWYYVSTTGPHWWLGAIRQNRVTEPMFTQNYAIWRQYVTASWYVYHICIWYETHHVGGKPLSRLFIHAGIKTKPC